MMKSGASPFALQPDAPAAQATTNRNKVKVPCGSELAEIPTRTEELTVRGFESADTIQRWLYGSYCTRGFRMFAAPVDDQKLLIETVDSTAPVCLSCIR